MTPKTPEELKEQLERKNAAGDSAEGHERTAEGKEVPTPTRGAFFGNLEKVSRDGADSSGE